MSSVKQNVTSEHEQMYWEEESRSFLGQVDGGSPGRNGLWRARVERKTCNVGLDGVSGRKSVCER